MRAPEPASVGSRERLRLFCALRLPEEALERLVAWQEAELPAEPGLRVVPRRNLHVTLAFLGSRPAACLADVLAALRGAAAEAGRLALEPRRYRETPRVGMIELADADDGAGRVAAALQRSLHELRLYEPERRPWTPHVTVVRFRGARPRLAPPLPELGTVSPSEAALYHSVPEPSGARYDVLESVALGGSPVD